MEWGESIFDLCIYFKYIELDPLEELTEGVYGWELPPASPSLSNLPFSRNSSLKTRRALQIKRVTGQGDYRQKQACHLFSLPSMFWINRKWGEMDFLLLFFVCKFLLIPEKHFGTNSKPLGKGKAEECIFCEHLQLIYFFLIFVVELQKHTRVQWQNSSF